MTEQVDRFTLTIGPDGRGLLHLALRRHPRANGDGFARAQRYWACAPGGAQPRWLALARSPGAPQRAGEHTEDPREAADAHAAAEAYLPGVACSWCGQRSWKPVNRVAVTKYVLTGTTGGCLICHDPAPEAKAAPATVPRPAPVTIDLGPPIVAEARILPTVTVRIDGAAAAMLWTATGGDTQTMSSLVTDLVARNFGIQRAGSALM
ncbi:hypothetical protein [Actinoplanes palleronii]|uniref:Uncharacterized protein n=1 Tax=Actinoplanes palleronii TaxID=113570 RepID=A0ABQ4BLX1_9ACTN|nr:hypothetical protein [Actinoplanes palleronii]GIE71668.1 hypothetical protein Apa02nite_077760 [Actinoplanes palleronii]